MPFRGSDPAWTRSSTFRRCQTLRSKDLRKDMNREHQLLQKLRRAKVCTERNESFPRDGHCWWKSEDEFAYVIPPRYILGNRDWLLVKAKGHGFHCQPATQADPEEGAQIRWNIRILNGLSKPPGADTKNTKSMAEAHVTRADARCNASKKNVHWQTVFTSPAKQKWGSCPNKPLCAGLPGCARFIDRWFWAS